MAQTTKTKYVHPEVLVDTQWVEEHLEDKNVRIVEVDYDPKSNYNLGHIPNSILIDWKKDINDPITRDILSLHNFEKLLESKGINNNSIVILYGDLTIGLQRLLFGFSNTIDTMMLDFWMEEERYGWKKKGELAKTQQIILKEIIN